VPEVRDEPVQELAPEALEPLPAQEAKSIPAPAREPGPPPERFILQFSTGESVTVDGTGLVGRNPRAEPGEYFDTLVTIIDPARSVSKTHLEFGLEDGRLWISDRYSGNGTVLREPDAVPRRCEPGRRYRVARGSRVELGDQFVMVT
jgi:hypothetical protein